MGYADETWRRERPGLVNLLAIVSLLSSLSAVFGFFVRFVLGSLIGAASLVFGPVAGAVGSFTGFAVILVGLLDSILGLLLCSAAVLTFQGDPRGLERHRIWAWIVLGFAFLKFVVGWSVWRLSTFVVVWALAVLHLTSRPDVRAYFHRPFATTKKAARPHWSE